MLAELTILPANAQSLLHPEHVNGVKTPFIETFNLFSSRSQALHIITIQIGVPEGTVKVLLVRVIN